MMTDGVGTFIRVEVPWWGVGAMVSGAISLLPEHGPVYCHTRNHFFNTHDGHGPMNGKTSPNSFDWFFDQSLNEGILWRIKSYRDEVLLPINSRIGRTTIDFLRARVKNHLVMKPDFCERSRQIVGDLRNFVGVHYRGTDKITEVERIDPATVAEAALMTVESIGANGVLLCTDEIEVVQVFKDVVGDKLRYFEPHVRIFSGTVGLHQASGSYLHALEAFTEIVSLGLCRRLLIGRSCFADAALLLSTDNVLGWEYYN